MSRWFTYYSGRSGARRRWWHWWLVVLAIPCVAVTASKALEYLRSPERAEPMVSASRVRMDITAIGQYLDFHYMDHGSYPPGPLLADALQATNYFGHDQPSVVRDVWGHALIYVVSADGQSATVYSCGPNGIDEHGAGDDIAIHLKAGIHGH